MTARLAPLTDKMLSCIDYMRCHKNKLVRFPGGYWAAEGWHSYNGAFFGTSTVQALVTREVAEYTAWKDGRSGKFPIEATLKEGK